MRPLRAPDVEAVARLDAAPGRHDGAVLDMSALQEEGGEQVSDATIMAVRTFRHGTDKECARKVPEEAAEAFAEWVIMTDTEQGKSGDHRLADELADTITACANLAARYGIDLQAALDRVEAHNRERGRYQ